MRSLIFRPVQGLSETKVEDSAEAAFTPGCPASSHFAPAGMRPSSWRQQWGRFPSLFWCGFRESGGGIEQVRMLCLAVR